MFEQELERASALYGLPLNAKQIEKFAIYYRLLIEWNAKMNLTAITEPREVAVKHIVDSLTALRGIEERDSLRLIDVGTGAGFPGIPLKIVRPDLKLTLLDSLKKRVHFLETVVEALGLEGAECLHGRAEEAARRFARALRHRCLSRRGASARPCRVSSALRAHWRHSDRPQGASLGRGSKRGGKSRQDSRREGDRVDSRRLARPFGQACSSRHKEGEDYAESVSAQGRQAGERTIALSCR